MSEMVRRVSDAIEDAMASDNNAPEDIARAAIGATGDLILGAIRARRGVYLTKADQRDPFAEPCSNRHDLSVHAAEAMDAIEAEVAAMFDAALNPSGDAG